MADPRFFRNHGPFTLAAICEKADLALPDGANGELPLRDLAGLAGAGPEHLAFYAGGKEFRDAYGLTQAGACLVPRRMAPLPPPPGVVVLACGSVGHAWAVIAALFYPELGNGFFEQDRAVDLSARLGEGVRLGPGVAIGAGAQVGEGSRIGAGAVIGPGVALGRGCDIGANAVITYAYLGDQVVVAAGATLGTSGFGYASGPDGHVLIPQLGRLIVQDRVEIGAGTAIDRGALGDTVIGEGTKIDNHVHIAHNVQVGRHCILAGQVGIAGSSVVEDYVFMGGQVGISDHCHIGAGARLGPRAAVMQGRSLEGGKDYGGQPAKPMNDYFREIHALDKLVRRRKNPSP